MNRGKLILDSPMSGLEQQFVELHAVGDAVAKAEDIPHIGSRSILGGKALIYEGIEAELLAPLGELRPPSVSDLFVAKVAGENPYA